MTYQEANALVDDFSFVYKGKSIPKEALIECREVIHKACEKQIPRKVDKIKECRQKDYYCIVCGYHLGDEMELKYAGFQPKFCPNCGQALDWSENSER